MKILVDKKGLLIYIAILALSVIFASFYGGPVSFVWLYALLLLLPISFLYLLISFYSLSLYQEIEVHKVIKGETHSFRQSLENGGFLPIHNMTFGLYRDRCDLYELREEDEISLDIHEKRQITSSIMCRYAGAYNVGVEYLYFSDPFRIFTVKFNVPYSFRAVVSPRITEAAESFLDIENLFNSTGFKSMQLYEDTAGSDYRAYLPGDSLGSINWKLSARFDRLFSRVPDRMEKMSVTIVLKALNSPKRERDIELLKKRDYFLEFAVSAAWHFGRQGVPVRLIYPAGEIKESVVDSYDSFLDFYNTAADGIFYQSEGEEEKLNALIGSGRDADRDVNTWILIREECRPDEAYCSIIG